MEQMIKSNIDIIEDTNLTPIEIALGVDQEGRTTAKKLYDFLELDKKNYSRWCKTNISENEFAEENVDFKPFVINEENLQGGRPTIDYKLSASFAKKLAMGTHNAKGEIAKNYFLVIEDKLKQKSIIDMSQLSPDLQMFKKIFDTVAAQQIESKQIKHDLDQTRKEVQSVREIVKVKPTELWRKESNVLVNKICMKTKDYKSTKEQIYKELDRRAGTSISTRLENMKKRLKANGATETRIKKLNYLDVIAQDKKLVEIYIAVIKELAISNGIEA